MKPSCGGCGAIAIAYFYGRIAIGKSLRFFVFKYQYDNKQMGRNEVPYTDNTDTASPEADRY